MSRFAGFDAEAIVTAVPAGGQANIDEGIKTGKCELVPRHRPGGCRARFYFGAGLPAGETRTLRFTLCPPSDTSAQLFPDMEFELHAGDKTVALGRITKCWFGCAEGFGVHSLSLDEFRTTALPAMARVFRLVGDPAKGCPNPIEAPFQLSVPRRGIIDCSNPGFELRHCRAFAVAAQAIRDDGLVVYVWEAGTSESALDAFPATYHPLQMLEQKAALLEFYEANAPFLGTAIFSASGLWGAVSSGDACHAVAGGSPEFINRVYAELDTTPEQETLGFFQGYEGANWLDDYVNGREPPRCPWVPRLLRHLYGDDEARRLIALAAAAHGR